MYDNAARLVRWDIVFSSESTLALWEVFSLLGRAQSMVIGRRLLAA